ncbi:metal ABC transporter substrate-binding protein [Caproiciproducens sp. CPB-2]|uniref:metal ABC transporter substrate-binding protein n=1 Tax=Caproiciproducens sp. CPB-2 TaxID=3030017 RepID=UPI0023DB06A2|nr:metal ABC transporter substrate-binding protein [Caproiciproducens sp. CPB-2]MDF1496373.1 metal ABC transporter substrate-binding protein [Caproiciproducens sp. CPB-2]
MFKRYTALLLSVAAVMSVGLSACGSNNPASAEASGAAPASSTAAEESKGPDSRIKVSVTFNAMKEFTEAVGKDKVDVATIIPDGTEPHDFEPKAQDLVALSTAQVFVYSGLGMEAWTEDAVKSANNPNLITVEASKGADPIKNTDPEEIEEHGQYDPHIWLSLKGAEIEVKNIKDALVKADGANQQYYEKNCDDFVSKLENLYTEYNKKFQSAEKKSFVTGHAAFGYLCRDFGLEQNSVEDVFAEGEPSAQQLTELVKYCKDNKVTTIFAEEMASPDVSKTLAKEVGANVETIYTIEGGEDNKTYLERVESNLSKIYASLESKT